MKWLIWKDYRVNRLVFITALVLLVAPHALVAIQIWRGMGPQICPYGQAGCYVFSSIYSLLLLQLAFALLGGNSIAGERIDRSAEFLAYLPVSRGRILASKLLAALAAVALVWLPNLVILAIAGVFVPLPAVAPPLLPMLSICAVSGLTFFCVAWFFSCILESPTFSVCAGLIVPFLVATGICWAPYSLGLSLTYLEFCVWSYGLCLAISAASFTAGTLYYLRRVEP